MRYATAAFLIALPAVGFSQDNETPDTGIIAGFLQKNLSGAGRQVQIYGFDGALSSKATIERLTIADDDGIWLAANNLVLDWDRSALLGGNVDISELGAESIELVRIPQTESEIEPEATPFALPELPVSLQVDLLNIETLSLGEDVLGQPLLLTINGEAGLAGGEGFANIIATRTDDIRGRFLVEGSYNNTSKVLDIALDISEAAEGLATTLIGLPGAPSVDLTVEGQGPLTDFGARLSLDTDGVERLAGTLALTQVITDTENALSEQLLDLDIEGDITSLFLPEYREFFGDSVQLVTSARRTDSGALILDNLNLDAAKLTLNGSAALNAEGWPERFDLAGVIRDQNGEPVLLPISGDETRVQDATILLTFDAEKGEEWNADVTVNELSRTGLSIDRTGLNGSGRILIADKYFDGRLDYAASGLGFDDDAVSDAVGDAIEGSVDLLYAGQTPFSLKNLTLNGAGIDVSGAIYFDTSEELTIATDIDANVADLSRFETLAGMPIGGAANLSVEGALLPLSSRFDVEVSGNTNDLSTGIQELDALLAGAGTLFIKSRRDERGSAVETLNIETEQAVIAGTAFASSGNTTADIDVTIADLGVPLEGMRGAANLVLDFDQDAEKQRKLKATLTREADTVVATADLPAEGYGPVEITADIAQLSAYADYLNRPLRGSISTTIDGVASLTDRAYTLDLAATASGLGLGVDVANDVLAGRGTLNANIAGTTENISVSGLALRFPNLTADADVETNGQTGDARFEARLSDIGILASDLSGPLSVNGDARLLDSGAWALDTAIRGPGGASADVNGTVGAGGRLDLDLAGQLPLGLANGVIEPRRLAGTARFDLSANGAPSVSALSGNITIENGDLSLPTLSQSLDNIGGTIALGGSAARIDVTADGPDGGNIAVRGRVGLTGSYDAALTAELIRLRLRDPVLYETLVRGAVSINGPLTGGARISGAINLGDTEIRVPSSSVTGLGDIPDVTHVGASGAVRQTLDRAGLSISGGEAVTSSSGPSYPIDLTINAPSRIFVRGRGLDAELGGSLSLTGTTNQIIPAGRFSLIRGRLDILQQRFALTEGSAQIEGDFVPTINLRATTEAETGTLVTIGVTGPATEPTVSFTSSPELPQDEVLSQLLFGRDLSSISVLQAAQLAAAVGTLAGRGGGGIVNSVRKGAGLDDLDITTDEEGNAAVRAGKYISRNVYTELTASSDGTTSIDLNLDLTGDLTAKGAFSSDGETSLGVFFERDY